MYMRRETVQTETEVIGWECTEARKASSKTHGQSKQLEEEALLTFHAYLRVTRILLTLSYVVPIQEFFPVSPEETLWSSFPVSPVETLWSFLPVSPVETLWSFFPV